MPSFSKIKLNDDILWQIFMFNSHPITCSMEHDAGYLLGLEFYKGSLAPESSLVTTRRASQVCRQWQQILLNSPYIWANMLDLQHLNQEGNQWRDEVLRRTGDAPLTVLGHVGQDLFFDDDIPHNIFTIPFFFGLLDIHWERIRSLVIVSAGMEVDSKLRIALTRFMPLLEHCVVSFHFGGNVVHFPTHAPVLSSFNVQGYNISLSVPTWGCKIKHLKFNWPRVNVVTSDLLESLAKMPLLETLFLDFRMSYSTEPETPTENAHISLPRLKHLTLKSPPGPDLLPSINIPPQCRISMYCGYQNHHSALTYPNFVQGHFHSWNITDISYEVELVQESVPQGQFYPCYQIVLKDCRQEHITPHFEYHGRSREMTVALSMAAALSSCQLHCITSFHLRLDVFEDSLNDPSFDPMYNLLRKLEFVKNLHTDKRTLELLPVAELRAGNLVFPKLHTVIVHEWDASLDKFLDSRRVGRPVTRVLFSEGSSVSVGDPTVLQKASALGITVGWKIEGIKDVREFQTSSTTGRL